MILFREQFDTCNEYTAERLDLKGTKKTYSQSVPY